MRAAEARSSGQQSMTENICVWAREEEVANSLRAAYKDPELASRLCVGKITERQRIRALHTSRDANRR
jgi:hypothetical protein